MKRVVVIGAGASGLPAMKSCLEEGMQVVCYESSDDLGGIWRYKEVVEENTASVFSSVVLNINKEMMAYSDFQPPLTFPTYPRHFQWLEYLESYADHFDLRKHIRFNHKVVSVAKADDYESTGRWIVEFLHRGQVGTEHFDFVIVCSGHHIYPHMPDFPGQSRFQGEVIHTKSYRRPEVFRGKNVVVVGYGNSAVDISNDICSSTKQTYLSTKRKGWIIPRVLEGRKLTINELYRRSFKFIYKFLPDSWLLRKEESLCNRVFDHDWINVKPTHSIFAQRPVINDFLPMNLLYGTIQLKPGIKEFTTNGIIFDGEDYVTQVDVVLLGTGFKPLFPFLKGMENANDYMDSLYKRIIPAQLTRHTLAFVGLVDTDYAIPVCAEMQARWTVAVFKGKIKLPERKVMAEDARRVQEDLKKRTYEGFTQKTLTHAPPYLEELATELGAKPNLIRLFFTDFKLFCGVFFGPLLPYQFRVHGRHAWEGARQAILDAERRDVHHLGKGPTRATKNRKCGYKTTVIAILGFLIGYSLYTKGNVKSVSFVGQWNWHKN